ncbi:MAG: tRNA pseudouridine(38-40) synthase TruA [Lachnospiraceae bacterium]|nr:tRNA pseudouridine(38-40) synthase TruA [Lachnospiraceae bacterium]
MRRIMITIAYDGTEYVGWQMQPNGVAVEQVINKALSELLKEDIIIAGASRTDSGVHADGNVAVFDTETRIPADKICFALNQRLPKDIVCTSSCEVNPDFHPRHADCTKTYEYRIYNAVHPDPLKRRYSYFVYVPLDIEAMRKAAEYLKGEHDFASFCSAHAQVKTTVRNIYSLDITTTDITPVETGGENQRLPLEGKLTDEVLPSKKYMANDIIIRISGNGFLYNMVRIIVGTLVKVGYHFYPPEYVKTILEACDRTKAGPKAPAEGLKLVGIEYRKEDYIPITIKKEEVSNED